MNRRHVLVALALAACKDGPGVDSAQPQPDAPWAVVADHDRAALMSLQGLSDDAVWAVGAADEEGGLVLHWDGATWTRVPNADPHDLWWVQPFADGSVVAVGSGGTVLRGTREGLTRDVTPGLGSQTLFGAWGSGPDDIWAVGGAAGRNGLIWRFDGASWSEVDLPDDIPLSAEGELPSLFKVWGRGPDDVWVVGSAGAVLHYDGQGWDVVPSGTSELLFTVHGDDDEVVIVGPNTVLMGDEAGLVDVAPEGVGLIQGACVGPEGEVLISGASGSLWLRDASGAWEAQVNASGVTPESLHAAWISPEGQRWAVGGGVLSASLDGGVILRQGALPEVWEGPEAPEPEPAACPADQIDPEPGGSIARRWNEQILNAIRRDIPRPGVHARNLFHLSLAMWDAWAVYDDVADPLLAGERLVIEDPAEREAARELAISTAAWHVLRHRYVDLDQVGADTTGACLDAFAAQLGLDPEDTRTEGDDPVAVGNRIARAVIETFADDGANEAGNYADTTGWVPVNPPLVVDRAGVDVVDPDEFQLLNLAQAETQNGIVLDSGLQEYIGAQWGWVRPFALDEALLGTYTRIDPGAPYPSVDDPEAGAWALDVLRKHSRLDPDDPEIIDISPGAYGNNGLGTNDGAGHALNPVTGQPYAPNVVPLGDFVRVLAEVWADGPRSETPPGHWNSIANDASDDMDPSALVIAELGEPLDRLAWDVHLYLALNGALHDAAIAAWGLKRESLGLRPITLIRWMAQNGQSSDPGLPSYHPQGLPLEDGVVELITEASSAPGERHHHLRWYVGEVAVLSWRGEPGDRANVTSGVAWMRGVDWFPYQRRTFVTPAFPGYVSGHSTFSRAAAEVLTRLTGSEYFPGGLGSWTAPAGQYLVFEDGPSVDVTLQWATWQDASDQAGQSRLWGGIHIWPDDFQGRIVGYEVGHRAVDVALPWFDGTALPD